MEEITTYLSILTLNANGLNSPLKSCIQKTHLINRNKHWLKLKGWQKIYQANGPRKQGGVAILISDNVDFKLKLVK
jgi:hypothetical protein